MGSFPSSGEERQRQGIASCIGIRSLLTHCLLWSILLSDMSVTRGGEGDVTAILMEQPVLSGGTGPQIETLTCCCYHSPCDQLRNSKYFLSDKGDWGRPEISGRVWASLRSKHQAREVGISPGSAGLQVLSGRGLGWCGNRASCLSLTFNPPPAWAGRTFPACFPTPSGLGSGSQGTHLGSKLCRG